MILEEFKIKAQARKIQTVIVDSMKKKKTQTSKSGLKRIFNEFAKKSVKDFPQLKDKFIIYSVSGNTWHGKAIDNPVLEILSEKLEKEALEDPDGSAAFANRAHGYYFIAYMNEPLAKHFMTKPSAPDKKEVLSILEHELGHLIAPVGFHRLNSHGYNFRECVADAFTLIRGRQKYRSIAGSIEVMMQKRSVGLVFYGDHDNFSMTVLHKLALLSKSHDLSKLTPTQSANLAYRLSLQYAYSEKQLRQLTRIFATVRKAYETDTETALKECAKIMFADHGEYSQMVFTIGETILEPFLNRRLSVLNSVMPMTGAADLQMEGKFWDNVRGRIKKYEDNLAKDTPGQRLASEAGYMQALGHFDRHPDKAIGPKKYESKENQAYLKSTRREYMAKMSMKQSVPFPFGNQ